MSSPQTRINEFLRQYKMGSGQHPKDIAGVYKDLDSGMAMLTVTDLEAFVAFVGDVRRAFQDNPEPWAYDALVTDVAKALETLDDTQ